MNTAAKEPEATPAAWQPFTFGGVAAFGGARLGRVLAAELIVALLVAATTVWFLSRAYCPVVLQAIQKMPETAQIRNGALQGVSDTVIAESKFLAIATIPKPGGEIGQDADLQLQLRQSDYCAGSVFWPDWGMDLEYGKGLSINLARSNLEPWWSAWKPVLLAAVGGAVALGLLIVWAVLATVYMAPAKLIALFSDRFLPWGGAWKLSSAALLPAAIFMMAGLLLYGSSVIDLVELSFFTAIHYIIGWVYLIGGSCKATKLAPKDAKRNPFAT